MDFEYSIDESVRGNRRNYIVVTLPDDKLAELASECDDRDEFEDRLNDWLQDVEWNNVQDCEDEIDETDDMEHCNDFYAAISDAADRFFQEEEDGEVEGRRKL